MRPRTGQRPRGAREDGIRPPAAASSRARRGVFICAATLLLAPGEAHAAPGQGRRLAGPEAQGPATASVTALHHNPAMLTRLPGLNVTATASAGVDVLHVRPYATDSAGLPTARTEPMVTLTQPSLGYFLGGSFLLDPVAIGVGVYGLDPQLRPQSDPSFRYHLADDPDWGCRMSPDRPCPDVRIGGSRETRTDWTLAVAWNAFDRVQLGLSVHFPRLSVGLGRDADIARLTEEGTLDCDGVADAEAYDERCTRRIAYQGRTKLRWFGLVDDGTAFDFNLTVGLATAIGRHTIVGIRYRTQPLLDRGRINTAGRARICRPGAAAEVPASDGTDACGTDDSFTASLSMRLPRELALGVSTRLGSARDWSLDANLYWIDGCPGGISPTACQDRDVARLTVQGVDTQSLVLSEAPIYRGNADRYGLELYGGHDLKAPTLRERGTHLRLLFGAGFDSPATRPSALTVARPDGWMLQALMGASVEVEQKLGSLFFAPGYALDVRLPANVGGPRIEPAYDPSASALFEASGGDLNGPSAQAVLSGRAQPTNAGQYVGHAHALMFSLRWAERSRAAQSRTE